MALWNGTSINSNETAMAFNQLANLKAIDQTRRKNGLLYALLGKDEQESTPGAGEGFRRLSKVSGYKIEVKLRGKNPTPATIADSAQTTRANPTQITDMFGAAVFDLAHYAYTHPIPHSELDRFTGDEAKTADYLQDVFDAVMMGYEQVWGTAFGVTGASGAPSRTVLGAPYFAVAGTDGTFGGDAYGTIVRDAANSDFRGLVNMAVGTWSLDAVDTEINRCILNGGRPSFASTGITVYGKVRKSLQGYTVVTYDEKWTKFGGEWLQYNGVKFTLDNYAPSGTMYLLTPSSWGFWKNNDGFTKSGVVNDVSLPASYVLQTVFWIQLICMQPNQNSLLAGIT